MKITADLNVLVRGVARDDAVQARAVGKIFDEATLIAVSVPCLCWLGGEPFVSFDKKAISLLKEQEQAARLL